VKELRKSRKWAQIKGFRDSVVNEVVRKRLAGAAAQNEERCKSLVLYWLLDHRELVEEIERSVSESTIRQDVLNILEQGFEATEVGWALRFDEREQIRSALEGGLWDELHDEQSPLLSRRTARRLEEENEQLRAELSKKVDDNDRLGEKISRLETKLKNVEQELKEEDEYVNRLEERVAEIGSEKEKVEEKRDELSDRIDELEAELESREHALEEARRAREQLDEQIEKVLSSVANTLDLSHLPDDISTAGDEIERGIGELRSQRDSLEERVNTLEKERDTLAPALDRITVAWKDELEKLNDKVEAELPINKEDHPEHDPSKDWREWLEEERSLVSDLLNSLEDPDDQHLSTIGQVQGLLRLRWYLLEWMRYGFLRHLQSTTAVIDHISDSN
jgi:chromosome segregation ATPase